MKDFLRRLLGQKLINYYHLIEAVIANLFYDFSSRKLHVIGVTGTDGKTTTVNLIARVLQEAKLPTSFVSSINAQIGQTQYDTGLHTTTPSPFLLQRLLRKMVREGSQYAVLEVTSHALDQYRTWGINFETAVITNVTHEHLDYHKTFEDYLKAKAKLFRKVRTAVLNRDDGSYNFLSTSPSIPPLSRGGKEKTLSPGSDGAVGAGEGGNRNSLSPSPDEERVAEGQERFRERLLTYGMSRSATIWANQITETLQDTQFTAHTPVGEQKIGLNLPGRFNVSNALAALAVGLTYNLSLGTIASGLAKVKNVSGRLEMINEGQSFTAVVDFAHTANALENLLSFLRPKVSGKLVIVFGAAGERDHRKRPKMGEVAARFADIVVITREDNRRERVEKICEEIASGIKNKQPNRDYFIIPDRRQAINFALKQGQKGDLVVATGKGHEQSLNIDGKELPWDDRVVMREELRTLGNSPSPSPLPRGERD